jgi:phage terminase Nu1 subunit (DNA packaging protein)
MFDGINGERGTANLLKLAGVSDRAVQQFVKELTELGLVRPVDGGERRGVVVERDEDAIVQWYLQRTRDEAKAGSSASCEGTRARRGQTQAGATAVAARPGLARTTVSPSSRVPVRKAW